MLIWIKDAPKFGVNSDAHVITYIDSIITCAKPPDDKQELKELVSPQYHNLSRTNLNPLQPNGPYICHGEEPCINLITRLCF